MLGENAKVPEVTSARLRDISKSTGVSITEARIGLEDDFCRRILIQEEQSGNISSQLRAVLSVLLARS